MATTQTTKNARRNPTAQPHLDALLDIIAHARRLDDEEDAAAPQVIGTDEKTGTKVRFQLHDDASAYASFGSPGDGEASKPTAIRGVYLRANAQVKVDPASAEWKLAGAGYSPGYVHRFAENVPSFMLADPTPTMKADALAIIERAANACLKMNQGTTLADAKKRGDARELASQARQVLRAVDHSDSRSYEDAGAYLKALRAVAADLDGVVL